VTPLAAPLSGPVRVEKDRLPILCPTAIDDRVRGVLDRVDGLAVLADQQSDVAARDGGGERLLVLLDREPGVHADLADDSLQQLAYRPGEFAVPHGRGGPSGSGAPRAGVRDDRRCDCAGGVFWVRRRVTRPCPTVHRFVVTQ